ncbi:MAG TPA: hypothetical protein ENH94_11700 [Phycisphaerales bacterium]|nr:hypothetical protein [Phycisphaerales bacterium]
MKNCFVFLIILLLSPITALANFNQNLHMEPQEIYLRIYPADRYVEIIEYNLLSTQKDAAQIKDDISHIKDLIEDANYCNKKFKFKYFRSVEESMAKERGFIKGHYHLVTNQLIKNKENMISLFKDVFGKVLRRKVDVTIAQSEIGLFFSGNDINVGQGNSLGAYAKGNKRAIYWKTGEKYYDIVLNVDAGKNKAIIKQFGQNVKSREISEEEINNTKNQSKPLNRFEKQFQKDADIYRLKHLKYYGELIEKYHKNIGKYPFQGKENKPVYVFIANDKQEKYREDDNPNPHKSYPLKSFIKELERGLNKKINEYYDPQFAPLNKPNFYMYLINEDLYFFAIHVSQYYGFATKINENYYKVEISNNPTKENKAVAFSDLIKNKRFIDVLNSKSSKPGFFEKREKDYLNYTKTK